MIIILQQLNIYILKVNISHPFSVTPADTRLNPTGLPTNQIRSLHRYRPRMPLQPVQSTTPITFSYSSSASLIRPSPHRPIYPNAIPTVLAPVRPPSLTPILIPGTHSSLFIPNSPTPVGRLTSMVIPYAHSPAAPLLPTSSATILGRPSNVHRQLSSMPAVQRHTQHRQPVLYTNRGPSPLRLELYSYAGNSSATHVAVTSAAAPVPFRGPPRATMRVITPARIITAVRSRSIAPNPYRGRTLSTPPRRMILAPARSPVRVVSPYGPHRLTISTSPARAISPSGPHRLIISTSPGRTVSPAYPPRLTILTSPVPAISPYGPPRLTISSTTPSLVRALSTASPRLTILTPPPGRAPVAAPPSTTPVLTSMMEELMSPISSIEYIELSSDSDSDVAVAATVDDDDAPLVSNMAALPVPNMAVHVPNMAAVQVSNMVAVHVPNQADNMPNMTAVHEPNQSSDVPNIAAVRVQNQDAVYVPNEAANMRDIAARNARIQALATDRVAADVASRVTQMAAVVARVPDEVDAAIVSPSTDTAAELGESDGLLLA